MPQSFASLHFHIVFSTTNRQQTIGGTKSNLMRSPCGIERKCVALYRAAGRYHQRQGLTPLAIHGRPCRGYCLPSQEQNRDPFRQPDSTYVEPGRRDLLTAFPSRVWEHGILSFGKMTDFRFPSFRLNVAFL